MTDVDRERLVADLRDLVSAADGAPKVSRVAEECEGSIRDYVAEFGTWYEALAAAGLDGELAPPEADREDLVADLERLASELGRPPTGDHIDERGEYDVETYELVFGSYILALEAAGIEPGTSQYNFAEVEPPEHRRATKNVRYLREHGPTPSSEMPSGSSVSDRQHGMWKFVVRAGQASSDSAGGVPEPVYYLKDEHDPEAVMRAFFDANEQMLAQKSYHALITGVRSHSPEWAEIAKEFLPDLVEGSADAAAEPGGALVVEAASDTIADAIERTVAAPTSDVEAVDGVDADEGYVWGLPEDSEPLWERIEPGDLVLATVDGCAYGFTVDDVTRDWNATTDLWAEYEDGVRIAGPDRPWPLLLVGTTGGDAAFGPDEFWDLADADRSDDPVQYVESATLADLRAEYDRVWEEGSDATGSGEGDSESTDDGDAVEIDAAVAALAGQRGDSFVDEAISEHLKRAVDGIEPTVDAVTADATAEVSISLSGNQRALIEALCGDDGAYASVDAFVEDAIRARLDVPDGERELSVAIDGPTAAMLERLAKEEGITPEALVERELRALVDDAV